MLARVLLVRHGETELNVGGPSGSERLRGWLDVPLDRNGVEQAKQAAEKVRHWPVDRIITSDLARAQQTAREIGVATGVRVDPPAFDLRPWNLGKLAGQPIDDVLPKIKLYAASGSKVPPGGEAFDTFLHRFLSRLRAVLADARARKHTIVIVTHTRNLQVTRAWLVAGAKSDNAVDITTMNDYENAVGTGGIMALSPEAVAS